MQLVQVQAVPQVPDYLPAATSPRPELAEDSVSSAEERSITLSCCCCTAASSGHTACWRCSPVSSRCSTSTGPVGADHELTRQGSSVLVRLQAGPSKLAAPAAAPGPWIHASEARLESAVASKASDALQPTCGECTTWHEVP